MMRVVLHYKYCDTYDTFKESNDPFDQDMILQS